jgi:hypothetical protein
VCEARVRDAAHIAANDPATALALLDVVEAAEEYFETFERLGVAPLETGAAYHRLRAALDRLKEVLR